VRPARGGALSWSASRSGCGAVVRSLGTSHFPETTAATGRLSRLLRPGGRLTATVWARGAAGPLPGSRLRAAACSTHRTGPSPVPDPLRPPVSGGRIRGASRCSAHNGGRARPRAVRVGAARRGGDAIDFPVLMGGGGARRAVNACDDRFHLMGCCLPWAGARLLPARLLKGGVGSEGSGVPAREAARTADDERSRADRAPGASRRAGRQRTSGVPPPRAVPGALPLGPVVKCAPG
jgi:hypothetical protein